MGNIRRQQPDWHLRDHPFTPSFITTFEISYSVHIARIKEKGSKRTKFKPRALTRGKVKIIMKDGILLEDK